MFSITMSALPVTAFTSGKTTDGGIQQLSEGGDTKKSSDSTNGSAWLMQLDTMRTTLSCTEDSLVQVRVSSKRVGESSKTVFEEFLYSNGRAIGLKREGNLSVPAEQKVSIKVDPGPKTCTSIDENRALAGTILRVVLTLLLNHDEVAQVILPDSNYSVIASELQSRRGILLPAGEKAPSGARVKFELQSASATIKQTMYFQ
ncbi:MAG: hypothetical protein K2W95_29025 [Candidatus Obscuribacterales bacterium]|nr:hypothetical protein [Candidatus Obscuribacterales bacterium]